MGAELLAAKEIHADEAEAKTEIEKAMLGQEEEILPQRVDKSEEVNAAVTTSEEHLTEETSTKIDKESSRQDHSKSSS